MCDHFGNVSVGVIGSVNASSFLQNKWNEFLDIIGEYVQLKKSKV